MQSPASSPRTRARIILTENLLQQRHCRAFYDLAIPDNSGISLSCPAWRSSGLPIEDLIIFRPTPIRDERGYFSRTLDIQILADAGIDPASFKQENQSRSYQGVRRGLHGRSGAGEAKLVRCANGAVLDVVVDARPGSPTFGQVMTFLLDDQV